MTRTMWIVLLLLCTACTAKTKSDDSGGPPDTDADTDADADTDTDVDCAAIATLEDGLTPTLELHVSTTGSDSEGDGSEDNPFATLEHAADLASPGTAIRIHPGTYSGDNYVYDLAGTADAPIWLGGVPGEARPIVDGGGEGLKLTRAVYVIVHDLEIRGATSNGINTDDGGAYDDATATHHLLFRDLYVHDIGTGSNEDCLKLSGLRNYQVLDSEFHDCGGSIFGSGIDQVGCHHGLIARNSFHDHSGNAVQVKGGSTDIEIRWNHMVEGGERSVNMGGRTGHGYFRPPLSETEPNAEARDVRVIGNLIEGAEASLAFTGCVDCVVAHNTIVDAHNWLLRILQEATTGDGYEFEPARDGQFVNNVVYFDRSDLSTYINVGGGTSPETFVFSNNLWYAHDDPGASTPDLPVGETAGIYGQDPVFTDGFAIGADSPAAGAGTPTDWLAGDITGTCYADTPSIGAYEVP